VRLRLFNGWFELEANTEHRTEGDGSGVLQGDDL